MGTAYADSSTVIRTGSGFAEINQDGFESTWSYTLSVEHHFEPFGILLGYTGFDEFSSENSDKTYVEVDLWNAGLVKRLEVSDRLNINGMFGVNAWSVDATLLNNQVGEDNGSSLWFGVGADLAFKMSRNEFRLYGLYEHFNDVSGSDINSFSVQLGFEF